MRSCLYEQNLLDHLVSTRDALQTQTWQPSPPVVFTVEKPKAREVYAAQFEDRVVHHWLVPQLEAVIDRDFIPDSASNRVGRGADFLGYIVRPGYRLVRRRVVGNLHERLGAFARQLVRRNRTGTSIDLPQAGRERLRAVLASYWGHFHHADSYRLRQGIFRDFPWLHLFFRDPLDLRPRWQPAQVSSLASQWRYFEREFPACLLIVQCGRQLLLNAELPGLPPYCGPARLKAWRVEIGNLAGLQARLRRYRCSYLFCSEEGYLQGGLKRRVLRRIWLSAADGFSASIPPNPKEKIV